MIARLKLVYYVLRNLRNALRDAMFGAGYAHRRRLERAGRVVLGPHTYGPTEILEFELGQERLITGSYCSLNGTFLLGGQHATDAVTTYPHRMKWKMPRAGTDGFPTFKGDTVLGSDVWTCAGALILSGVTIGDGAIVGAGSVVTRDVPPYAIVGGNPAKVLRYRYPEDQRAALLAIRWWDWPDEVVREAVPLLAGTDLDAFFAFAQRRASQDEPGR